MNLNEKKKKPKSVFISHSFKFGAKNCGKFIYSIKYYNLGNFIYWHIFLPYFEGRLIPEVVVPQMPSVFRSYFQCGGKYTLSVSGYTRAAHHRRIRRPYSRHCTAPDTIPSMVK